VKEARKDTIIIVFRYRIRTVALPLLILPLAFLMGACQLVEASSHITYAYSIMSLPKDRMTNPEDHAYTYRAGEKLPLSWIPRKDKETQDTKPQTISINAGLVGPFATIDALKSDMSFDSNNVTGGRIAAIAPPLQTNNWTNKAVMTDLRLPTAPGYYMLVQRILVGRQGPPYAVPTGQIISILK
jgi:hypothetical protein